MPRLGLEEELEFLTWREGEEAGEEQGFSRPEEGPGPSWRAGMWPSWPLVGLWLTVGVPRSS